MADNAPVVVYTYTRIDHLKKTISALQLNHLAAKTDLFVVSDGPKDQSAKSTISALREYIDSIDGFNAVIPIYRESNVGIRQSVKLTEGRIISDYGKLISMEDDIVTSRNYLDFINAGLNYYESSDEIYSISGYCHPISYSNNSDLDSWISPWFCPWGYGILKKQFDKVDRDLNPFSEIRSNREKYRYLKKYGNFFIQSLEADARGQIYIPDARTAAHMLIMGLSTVMPSKSKVSNIGLDGSGMHCPKSNKFDVVLDNGLQREFLFSPDRLDMNCDVVRQYLRFMNGTALDIFMRDLRRSLSKVTMFQYVKKRLFY